MSNNFKFIYALIYSFLVFQVVIILKSIQYSPPGFQGTPYPDWAQLLGWLMVSFTVVSIPVWMIGYWLNSGAWRVRYKALAHCTDFLFPVLATFGSLKNDISVAINAFNILQQY